MAINSVDKIIEYVVRVAKQRVVVEGHVLLAKPIEQVTVRENFFAKDDCHGCGRCCMNENIAYTIRTFDRACNAMDNSNPYHEELRDGADYCTRTINGAEIEFLSFDADTPKKSQRFSYEGRPENLQRCHFLNLSNPKIQTCNIHACRSITCGMPHMRFYHTSDSRNSSISLAPYGRNHQLGCPVVFAPYDGSIEHEEAIYKRIKWLEMLELAANDMGIATWLPEILHKLDVDGVREEFVVKLPTHHRLFEGI